MTTTPAMYCNDCIKIASPSSKILSTSRFKFNVGIDKVRDTWMEGAILNGSKPSVMEFKPSFKELEDSAGRGCKCCIFFVDSVRAFEEATPKGGKLFMVRHTSEVGIDVERLGGSRSTVYLPPTPEEKDSAVAKLGDYVCLYEEATPLARFNLCIQGLDSRHDLRVTQRLVFRRANYPESMEYVRKRLQDCTKNHPECTARPSSFMPSRLLDLSMLNRQASTSSQKVRLISTADESISNESYVALSHCWGKPSAAAIKTTSSNYTSHMNGIRYDDLPLTFRDAIYTSHKLGIKYIWIDSLCIIQDSNDDWAKESAVMGEIYQAATLTIAASSAKDSTEGLFGPRYQMFTDWILLPGQESRPEDERFSLQFYRKHFRAYQAPRNNPLTFTVTQHFAEPLSRRLWTLQERLLSTRTIFYDKVQLLWECRTARFVEGWTKSFKEMGLEDRSDWKLGFQRVNKPNPPRELTPSRDKRQPTTANYPWWYEMLMEYRSRNASFATDALPALSGISKEFGTKIGDSYAAGIWKGDFLAGLTWRLEIPLDSSLIAYKNESSRDTTVPPSIGECFAPSWSWASLLNRDGRDFRPNSLNGDMIRRHYKTDNSAPPIVPLSFRQRHAKVIKIELKPRSFDPRGHLSSAKLVLSGWCRKIIVRRHAQEAKPRQGVLGWRRKIIGKRHPEWTNSNPRQGETMGLFNFEMNGVEPKWLNQYVYCSIDYPSWLESCMKKAEALEQEYALNCVFLKNTSGLHCLLLERVEDQVGDLWRRCGVASIEYRLQEFEAGWEMGTLNLI